MPSHEADWRRLAAELVLHFHKTPSQVSRICGCGINVVRQCVAEYVRQGIAPDEHGDDESPFIPVTLVDADEPVPSPSAAEPIPLDILAPNGLTLRLQLASLDDVAALLRALEVAPC